MSLQGQTECLICKNKDYRVIFSYDQPDRYEEAVGVRSEGYLRKWIQCSKCGLYYSIYSREEGLIEDIYASRYRDKDTSWRRESPKQVFERVTSLPKEKSETKLRVDWIKENINSIWKHDLLSKHNPPYYMLDVGGGSGVLVYEFQDADWVAHVIDPGEESRFVETLGIPFVQDYYRPNSFDHKFDLITLVYVLEHLSDPISCLENLQNDMTENSLLFIEVPDAICFKHMPANDDIFNSCHLWMLSPNTITSILERCGFELFSLNRLKTFRGHYALMVLVGLKR